MAALIALNNIEKRFGKNLILKNINLEINKGEIFGLLGPNGAGKTTLMRSLLGLLKVNQGTFSFKGNVYQSQDIQKHFGFLPESFLPPKNLNAAEFLRILSWSFDLKAKDINSLFKLVGLWEHRKKPIRAYSRGMIQRLGLASCLLKDPEVVILDEPTLGLDPLGQKMVLNLLAELNKNGKTIFFSSHSLSQIEGLCTRIAIIHEGCIVFVGTVEELFRKHNVSSLEAAFLEEVEAE
jgi:ABC-2 type transport system ATP-binding protein